MRSRPRSFVRPSILVLAAAISGPLLADGDPGWPRQITVPEAKIVIYQPQPDEYEGNILTGRAAVSVTPTGKKEPVFGAVWLRARVEIDREKRLVEFADLTVPRVKFPGAKPEDEQKLASIIEKEFPKWDLKVSLDRLVASLQLVQKEKAAAEAFNTKPPRIVIEKVPALLVVIDGEPVLRDVEGSKLKRVINTAYFLVFDGKTYYLNGSTVWFAAEDLKGEWSTTKKPPKEVSDFYQANLSKEAQAAKGSTKTESTKKDSGKPPKIVVATEPTELIVLEGEPKMSTITGTDLLYVSNTKSDVFMVTAGQDYYILLSGRWFMSKSLDGPWTFVKPDALPEGFKKIPEPSSKGSVLASVAGTVQADEALIDAQIPQTAAVKRSEAKTKVEYDGKPEFKKIPNTEVEYAVNTASQVMRIKGKYYVCDQAVWFVGDSPNGPWTVADKAPPEVQQIPPDSPVYNTKYVYVYESTPEVVYTGYMPGYVGCYPYYGTVVWGTGWYYPPYVSPYAYYPYHATWGFSFHYNPYTGWSMGIGVSFGPITFSFWGGGAYGGYWGPGYGGGYYHGGNTINIGEINVGGDGNRNPGRGDRPQPKGTNSNIYNKSDNKARNASTKDKSSRPQPKNMPSASNNLYTDRDGNVHKRSSDGSWQTREGSSWKSSPSTSQKDRGGAGGGAGGGFGGGAGASSMERDYQSRQRGSARTQSFQGGGGMRGGGGGGRRR